MKRRDLLKTAGAGIAGSIAPPGWTAGAASSRRATAMPGMPVERDVAPPIAVPPEPGARSLDDGWRFHPGDIVFPELAGHEETYSSAKAGAASGAAADQYDDSAWRVLDLPHDWAIEQAPDRAANVSQGYRRRGIGWYRRALRLDPADHGRYLEIRFGGIAMHNIDVPYGRHR